MKISNYIHIDYFLDRKLKTAATINKRKQHVFKVFEDIKNIVILFNWDDWNSVEQAINDLERNNKTVRAWTVKPKEKDATLITFPSQVRAIDRTQDINWQQVLLPKVEDEFLQQKYDTLIDLTTSEDKLLTYLLLINESDFCLGFKKSENKNYDFIILKEESSDNIFEAYEQMKFYLNNLFNSPNNL